MPDEFDAFDTDFVSTEDFDFDEEIGEFEDPVTEENEGERKNKETNPLKIILNKFLGLSRSVQVAIIGIPVIIVLALVFMNVARNSGVPDEIEIPYYYSPKEYKFKLDEFVEGKVPYIKLQLELVFDSRFSETSKTLEEAYYQIREDVVTRFKKDISYDDLKSNDSQKRQRVYEESMEYINRLLGDPIVKEIAEVLFETSLLESS